MLDFARSVAAAKTISIERKACYKNALLTMLSNKEYWSGWYVEGFAIPTIGAFRIPMEHGWLELPDGSIIDPSFADLGHTEVAYFPAIKLQWKRVLKLCRDNPPLPYMLLHRTNHHRAAYLKARSDAHQAAFGKEVVPLLHRLEEEVPTTAAPRQPVRPSHSDREMSNAKALRKLTPERK